MAFFECSSEEATLTCKCRYVNDEDTIKAKKGFHELEVREGCLTPWSYFFFFDTRKAEERTFTDASIFKYFTKICVPFL